MFKLRPKSTNHKSACLPELAKAFAGEETANPRSTNSNYQVAHSAQIFAVLSRGGKQQEVGFAAARLIQHRLALTSPHAFWLFEGNHKIKVGPLGFNKHQLDSPLFL
jgi:hypothetical protein